MSRCSTAPRRAAAASVPRNTVLHARLTGPTHRLPLSRRCVVLSATPEGGDPSTTAEEGTTPADPLSPKRKVGGRDSVNLFDPAATISRFVTKRFGILGGLGFVALLASTEGAEIVKALLETETEVDGQLLPTGSGLQLRDVKIGGGNSPNKGDFVGVNLLVKDGDEVLLDTRSSGRPIAFTMGRRPYTSVVCAGLEEGVTGMKRGGVRELVVPPELGTAGVALLLSLARERLPQMPARQLANTLWAVSKLGVDDPMFVDALIGESRDKLTSFDAQALANTATALAKLGHVDTAFMQVMLETASSKLSSFTSQNLANLLWAVAKVRNRDDNFVSLLLAEAKPWLSTFKPQELTNTLWALATFGHKDAAFICAVLVATVAKLPSFIIQDLANTCCTAWALATLGYKDEAFMDALLVAAKPLLPTFNEQNLANTVWALAILGHNDEAFMAALLATAKPKLPSFNSLNVTQMSFALTQVMRIKGHKAQVAEFTRALDARRGQLGMWGVGLCLMRLRGRNLDLQQLDRLVTDCETADRLFSLAQQDGHAWDSIYASAALTRAAKLLEGANIGTETTAGVALLLSLAQERLPQMQPLALSNTLWAVSKLGVNEPGFVSALVSEVKAKLPSFEAQELANTAYALSNLGHVDIALMRELLESASPEVPSFNSGELVQMRCALNKLNIKDAEFERALAARRAQLVGGK
ncbi:hypothetical protein FOA52_013664 [Chlamydomonas sp. UWO 241]|nr:hypothetical protein FOA52_013664 [Chlamydomonas sp. UWO 241]